MFRALIVKELREIWWLGLLPLGFMLHAVIGQTELSLWDIMLPRQEERLNHVPFDRATFGMPDLFLTTLQWGCILAAGLGLWQTFRESQSRTWHFVMFRPVEREQILRVKVLTAGLVYGLSIVLPMLGLTLWAATPGTHASPFHWSLTARHWYAVGAGTAIYPAAFFAGLRRGSIIGARWWPLIAATGIFGLLAMSIPIQRSVWIWLALILWDALLFAAVRGELRSADFN